MTKLLHSVVLLALIFASAGRLLDGGAGHEKRNFTHRTLGAASGAGLLSPAPAPVLAGGGLAAVMGLVGAPIDLVYALSGGGTTDFWQYRISQNLWTALPSTPAPVGDGGGIVQVASYNFCSTGPSHFDLAVLRGGQTTDFWFFDISAGSWCKGPDTPASVERGAAIAQLQGQGRSYVLRGGGTTEFWSIGQENRWTKLASTPGPVGEGGALVGINYGIRRVF
jgi:hypothetical protein